jgi:hypothetical protein
MRPRLMWHELVVSGWHSEARQREDAMLGLALAAMSIIAAKL